MPNISKMLCFGGGFAKKLSSSSLFVQLNLNFKLTITPQLFILDRFDLEQSRIGGRHRVCVFKTMANSVHIIVFGETVQQVFVGENGCTRYISS